MKTIATAALTGMLGALVTVAVWIATINPANGMGI